MELASAAERLCPAENGEAVAVKVLYPGVEASVAVDLAAARLGLWLFRIRRRGIAVGRDFLGFYTGAAIVARGEGRRLYDPALQKRRQVEILAPDRPATDSPVAGKAVVFSGKMVRGSRAAMQAEARELGARVQTAVSSNTDYLVCGENVGAKKIAKARELGLTVLTEADYLDMIAKS